MGKKLKTTITLKNQYGKYAITAYKNDLDIGEMMEDLVEPLFLAAGYNRKSFYWRESNNNDAEGNDDALD